MKTVQVNLCPRSYPIHIGSGLLNGLGSHLKVFNYGKKILLITNPAVSGLYGDIVKESLIRSGFEVVVAEVGDGEEHKKPWGRFEAMGTVRASP